MPSLPMQRPVDVYLSYHKDYLNKKNKIEEEKGLKSMRVSVTKPILILFFILSTITLLRLLKITTSTSSSSHPNLTLPLIPPKTCSSPSPTCTETPAHHDSTAATILAAKEFQLLSKIVSFRAPCNLLVFGFQPQFLILSSLNGGGTTVFLEENPVKIRAFSTNSKSIRIYKVEYSTVAGEAYKLLKQARTDPACTPQQRPLQASTCKLALTKLPWEVYERKWDVVVIDGPRGDSPEAPGRMAAIYTISMMARAGNMTDILVHDVDRMIEKWFSWEFLCDENLVSSKGKFWHFRIKGNLNSTSFCSNSVVQIQ
ncbi:glucuronoxylan 4-O-methyltransferase 1-like [Telopea speciosissima]|uniref:glucuronoxylan 4-O-methyltransferase 1-like n=1 Tax=Telopea speciosissima TaxID=54955 RepID=UPI001CC5623A|nr:glucuronoxylan 4-O-methyltransferase 1-like [Telopea speciosissima]